MLVDRFGRRIREADHRLVIINNGQCVPETRERDFAPVGREAVTRREFEDDVLVGFIYVVVIDVDGDRGFGSGLPPGNGEDVIVIHHPSRESDEFVSDRIAFCVNDCKFQGHSFRRRRCQVRRNPQGCHAVVLVDRAAA